ncbi:MAG: hypothetical protein ABI855_20330 [Bacteroidota bacterium]
MKITAEKFFITMAAIILFLYGAGVVKTNASIVVHNIDVTEFYAALETKDTLKINAFLKILMDDTASASIAYKGALLMTKSAFQKSGIGKLAMFKKGKLLLEEEIKKENTHAEFRFLRLIIQENCPSFLKYHDKINEDASAVKIFYKKFSPELKHAVTNYSKVSKILKPADFAD